MPKGGGNLNNQLSVSKDGLILTSYRDDYIARGQGFEIHRRLPLTSAQTLYAVFDLSGVDAGKFVFSMPLKARTSIGQVYIDSYLITSYTGGAEIPEVNSNRASSLTAQGALVSGVTPTGSPGNDLRQYIIGQATAPVNEGGGPGSEDGPKIWLPDDLVGVKIVNQENEAIDLELFLQWFEISTTNVG